MEDCIFCKIVKGEIPSQKVYEDENVFAFDDINPVSPKHVLVIPKKHVASLAESCDGHRDLLGDLLCRARAIAYELGLKDYRLVINNGREVGQTVFHLHVHLMGGRFFSWPPG
jgi:histidine triad (HIT) family protein